MKTEVVVCEIYLYVFRKKVYSMGLGRSEARMAKIVFHRGRKGECMKCIIIFNFL